jgi:hypothetical protein
MRGHSKPRPAATSPVSPRAGLPCPKRPQAPVQVDLGGTRPQRPQPRAVASHSNAARTARTSPTHHLERPATPISPRAIRTPPHSQVVLPTVTIQLSSALCPSRLRCGSKSTAMSAGRLRQHKVALHAHCEPFVTDEFFAPSCGDARRPSTPRACLLSLTVRLRAMSGLSRSWCSSASISPFAVSCGRGADLALAAPARPSDYIVVTRERVSVRSWPGAAMSEGQEDRANGERSRLPAGRPSISPTFLGPLSFD